VKIDADTEGVLGHVPVTETILKKISVCDAFVPDLTFVAETPDGKLIPNPNVMLEYGYALSSRTFSIMIPVMNTAYGPPEKLPFDMGHARHPIAFNLSSTAKTAERRAARSSLAQEFERILRLMIDAAEFQKMERLRKDAATRQFLAPELFRTIERALSIHSRALVNFSSASAEHDIKPNDQKEDFLPYVPKLYPNAPQVMDLAPDDAVALSTFYDSLQSLNDFVKDWWAREGQLPVNIFNSILHSADRSLEAALVCIERFDLDRQFPPHVAALGDISSRIKKSQSSAARTAEVHIARVEAKAKAEKTAALGQRRR